MSQSTLRQVLTVFEEGRPLTLAQIAHELNVSPAQLEEMIRYWVRKGKIRESAGLTDCGTCGRQGGCPFVLDLPRSYELATPDSLPLPVVGVHCGL